MGRPAARALAGLVLLLLLGLQVLVPVPALGAGAGGVLLLRRPGCVRLVLPAAQVRVLVGASCVCVAWARLWPGLVSWPAAGLLRGSGVAIAQPGVQGPRLAVGARGAVRVALVQLRLVRWRCPACWGARGRICLCGWPGKRTGVESPAITPHTPLPDAGINLVRS